MSEAHGMAIFDAAALALTFFYSRPVREERPNYYEVQAKDFDHFDRSTHCLPRIPNLVSHSIANRGCLMIIAGQSC
jgi:hypothetical protein